ncbi:MAG: hypothetical protein AABW58_00335 [Nanoarchaeota archaeon]
MDLDEKEKIKQSFLKVKEDMESLKTQLNEVKSLITELIKNQNSEQKLDSKPETTQEVPSEMSSTGNQGVYTNIHSFIHSHMHSFNKHSANIQQTNMQTNPQINSHLAKQTQQFPKEWSQANLTDIDSMFLTLTKGEFLCFLTIFQLEEDLNRGVSYLELSRQLSLSEGCIRTYVSQMLKKAVPLQKIRLNNKLTLLLIDKSFRSLNLKLRLMNLFSRSDPTQTTLY